MSTESIAHLFAQPTRRDFLRRAGAGFGALALEDLLAGDAHAAGGKAKRVIWLFMNGGPSQVDTWDYKPALEKHDGQELKGFDAATGFFADSVGPIMKSPFAFARNGQSGAWVSEIFPNHAQHVDKMAFLHSCYTETNNHAPTLGKPIRLIPVLI